MFNYILGYRQFPRVFTFFTLTQDKTWMVPRPVLSDPVETQLGSGQ